MIKYSIEFWSLKEWYDIIQITAKDIKFRSYLPSKTRIQLNSGYWKQGDDEVQIIKI